MNNNKKSTIFELSLWNLVKPLHWLVILTKFYDDSSKIVDFLLLVTFWSCPVFYGAVSSPFSLCHALKINVISQVLLLAHESWILGFMSYLNFLLSSSTTNNAFSISRPGLIVLKHKQNKLNCWIIVISMQQELGEPYQISTIILSSLKEY